MAKIEVGGEARDEQIWKDWLAGGPDGERRFADLQELMFDLSIARCFRKLALGELVRSGDYLRVGGSNDLFIGDDASESRYRINAWRQLPGALAEEAASLVSARVTDTPRPGSSITAQASKHAALLVGILPNLEAKTKQDAALGLIDLDNMPVTNFVKLVVVDEGMNDELRRKFMRRVWDWEETRRHGLGTHNPLGEVMRGLFAVIRDVKLTTQFRNATVLLDQFETLFERMRETKWEITCDQLNRAWIFLNIRRPNLARDVVKMWSEEQTNLLGDERLRASTLQGLARNARLIADLADRFGDDPEIGAQVKEIALTVRVFTGIKDARSKEKHQRERELLDAMREG